MNQQWHKVFPAASLFRNAGSKNLLVYLFGFKLERSTGNEKAQKSL